MIYFTLSANLLLLGFAIRHIVLRASLKSAGTLLTATIAVWLWGSWAALRMFNHGLRLLSRGAPTEGMQSPAEVLSSALGIAAASTYLASPLLALCGILLIAQRPDNIRS